ncbi:hypothetical protein [Acinetobacter johnsonii]|uniref:hypothetical protein n=1 Tax=Acinetobacter johnsonii TaxID=40214 RepID=UPI0024494939|nr:hypothetical protein [Acinetobacter johnsonii]MDH1706888.1 hypothetical protein [Acinetobacter johnsonii]
MSNIKDIKNPAPFYTLKDAAKELNRFLKVDYYDAKKLLNMALAYDLQLYIFVKGWKGQASYAEEMTPEWDEYADVNKHGGYTKLHFDMDATLQAIINARLNLFLREGCLLEVRQELIKDLLLSKQIITDSMFACFGNILDIQDCFVEDPQNHFVEVFKQRPSTDLVRELGKSKLVSDVIASVVDIKIAWIELLHEELNVPAPKNVAHAVTPTPIIDSTVDKEGQPAIYQDIGRKDILITHYQLSRIIEGTLVLKDAPVETIETLIEKEAQRPRGKSRAKEHAQLAAKAIAIHEWKNDREKQIKIGEMCEIVWSTLIETEHMQELPSKPESLKDWIKEIAPGYAKEAGRPKRNI